jgi:translation elongation factor EF-Tu-like GTPase
MARAGAEGDDGVDVRRKIYSVNFVEARVAFLPTDAGGRARPIAPREGSYRPHARVAGDAPMLRIRFIEGPPRIAPGEEARVVVEIENDVQLAGGCELDVLEHDRVVGLMTVTRVWLTSPPPPSAGATPRRSC